jgi:hypothetical protein
MTANDHAGLSVQKSLARWLSQRYGDDNLLARHAGTITRECSPLYSLDLFGNSSIVDIELLLGDALLRIMKARLNAEGDVSNRGAEVHLLLKVIADLLDDPNFDQHFYKSTVYHTRLTVPDPLTPRV